MSHPAKSLPPIPQLTVCAGANWKHDLLERPGSTTKGEMAAPGALGCWDMPQGPVFCPTGSPNTGDSGAAESESPCVSQSVCVTSLSPWPALCSCSGSNAGGPDGQTGSTALPGAALCEESDRLSLTRSFTAPGFTNPGGFYNPLGCGGVCPGKRDSQNCSHF